MMKVGEVLFSVDPPSSQGMQSVIGTALHAAVVRGYRRLSALEDLCGVLRRYDGVDESRSELGDHWQPQNSPETIRTRAHVVDRQPPPRTGVPSSSTHVSRTAFHRLRIQLHCRRGLRHRDNRRSGTGLPRPQPVSGVVDHSSARHRRCLFPATSMNARTPGASVRAT